MRSLAKVAGWLRHLAIAITQQHHPELRAIFSPLIPRNGTVLEGAHAGQFSKLFARLAPAGVVHAIEPSAYARSVLYPALFVNRIRNVAVHPIGLSDEPGALVLNTPIKRRGGMGFGTAHLGAPEPGAVRQTVNLTTLDIFVAERNIERIDFIKADIEGWEAHMIRGGTETLRRFQPAIYMEIDHTLLNRANSNPDDLWNMLISIGYKAQFAPRFESVSEYAGKGDYLFTASR